MKIKSIYFSIRVTKSFWAKVIFKEWIKKINSAVVYGVNYSRKRLTCTKSGRSREDIDDKYYKSQCTKHTIYSENTQNTELYKQNVRVRKNLRSHISQSLSFLEISKLRLTEIWIKPHN